MAIRSFKPVTPGSRGMTTQDLSEITSKSSVKSLVVSKKSSNGRNNQGRITTRHKGGGVRKHYRIIDFTLADGVEARVEHIEYDPNRSARIARLIDTNGKYHYIIAALGMKQGDQVSSHDDAAIEVGNRLSLRSIPTGSTIYAIELQPGKGSQLARSAGSGAQLIAKDDNNAQIRLPSGEVRIVSLECKAHIGSVGNPQHQNVKIGKAGRNRRKGIRPTVRGVVMNAVDHPHGGGDGGRHRMARAPVTPWGQKTLGFKTRTRKSTDKYIVKNRHQAKRGNK